MTLNGAHRPRFKWELSLGTVIQLFGLLAAAFAAYYALKHDVSRAMDAASQASKQAEKVEGKADANADHITKTLEAVNSLTRSVDVLNNTVRLQSKMQEQTNRRLELDIRDLKEELRRQTP